MFSVISLGSLFRHQFITNFKEKTTEAIDISESEFVVAKKPFAIKASNLKVTEYELQFMSRIDNSQD